MKKLHARFVSFLLSLIMVFSMIPAPAHAIVGGNYGMSGSGDIPPGKAVGDWKASYGTNTFLRFTLVEFPDGVLDGNITNYRVVGHSVNIYHLGTDEEDPRRTHIEDFINNSSDSASYVKWYDSNAMTYLKGGAEAIKQTPIYDGAWGHANEYVLSYSEMADKYHLTHEEIEDMMWVEGPKWGGAHWENADFTSFFGGDVSYIGALRNYKAKPMLGQVIKLLEPEKTDPSWSGLSIEQTGDKFSSGTTDSGKGTRYRLLIEPGQFLHLSAIDKEEAWYALTVRDMAAYNKVFENGSTSKGSIPHDINSLLLKRGINMAQAATQFVEYDVGSDGRPIDGTQKISTGGFTAADMTIVNDASTGGTNKAVYMINKTLGSEHMAYGLGIISPMNFVRSSGLTVMKKLAGVTDPAVKDKLWEFTLTYSKTGTGGQKLTTPKSFTVKAGNTDITNDTSRVTKNGNDGFTFKAKADEIIAISFEYNQSEGDVYYRVAETDPAAESYTKTMLLNDKDVSMNDSGVPTDGIYGNTSEANTKCVFVNSAGLTVSKKAVGAGMADKEFAFLAVFTDSEGNVLPNGSKGTMTKNGVSQEFDFGQWNGANFFLKNGESVSFQVPGTWRYRITENEAGVGYATKANGKDLTAAEPWVDGTVSNEPSVEFVNTKADGNAHLIIDYNFNGANATTGEGSSDDHTASSATADCGAHAVGDAVTIAPKLNGAALTEGQTIPIPGLNGTCAECGGAYSAMMTFKGIYTAPTGGTKVGSTYTIDHEGLTILYAQWAPSLSMNCNHTVTTPGGPGTGTTGDLYTVFWDYNYTSSAVTSSVCGEFEIWYRLDNCEITFDESGMIDEHTDSYSRVKVTYGFSVPNSNGSGDAPYRQGYTFLGWDTDREKFKNTQGSTLPAPTAPGKSTTYYAIWRANSITWNANGGLFDFADDPSQFDTTTYELQDGGRKVKWLPIVLPATTQAPIVKYVPHRTGYTFAGWFFDANCTVPITESDWGIEPDRTYYAGWNAEKVVVNYYDVRQGTAPIMSQTFDYDDAFSLLSYMNDSDGWTFTGWKLAQLDGGMMPAKPVATTTGAPGTGTILNERLGTAVINYHQGDKDHTGSWNDPNSDPALTAEGYWEIDLVASWNEETTSYTTTIVWNDYQNNDGARPKSVEVGLISSITRAEVASENVTGNMTADNWSVTFPNLSITNNDASVEKVTYIPYLKSYTSADGTKHAIQDTTATNGEILTAPVSHADTTAAARYTYAINNINMGDWNMGYDGTIYFNHDLITTGDDLKFTIQWEDERNNDGFRPSAVTLTLFANGIPVKNFTGSGAHLSQTGVVSVNPGMCDISMNGSAWTYTFKDYQKYDKGAPIDYSVVISDYNQVKHDAYSPEELQYLDPADIGGRAGVILTHAIERSNCPVIVEWDDENNRDGIRPGAVTVTLTAYEWNADTYRWEETLVGTKLVMGSSTAENWNTEFENVKVYNGGQKIIYKASVSSDLNAHIPAGSNGYSWIGNETRVTISHNKDVKDVPVIIHWDDHNNNDAIRPVSAVVQLWADGVRVPGAAHAATVSGSDKDDVWAYTFKDMPIYRDGKSGEEIVYTITVEESVKDSIYGTYITTANGEQQRLTRYTATYMYTDAEGETVTTDDAALSDRAWVRLTHAIDQGTIDVYASWHDEQNRDNKRPASLQVELYKQVDGVREYMRTLTLVAGRDNSWSSKITGLPLYEGGKPVTYLVDISEDFRGELESTYGYTVSTQDNVVHLYYTPQTGTVSTKLYWADNDDNDNIRPDTVKATLYVNGVATSMTLDLNAENDWSATWTDLDTYFGDRNGLGQLTVYSVKVEDVDGYTVTYTPESVTTEDNQVIFINMNHGANVSNIPVRIYWNDDRNMDNLRPENVTVQLYADGEPVVGKTLVMTGDSLSEVWSGVFENMPTHNNGNEIFYTVQAADTIGRTFEVMTAGTSLYLSHDAQKGDLYVSFRFDDSNNADGYRPEGGYLQLQVVDADGNEEDVIGANGVHTIYFDADGRVNDYFRGLPINKTSGSALKYTVKVEWDDDQFGGRGEKYEVKYSRPIALSTVSQNQLVITAAEKNETGLGVELGTETGVVYWFDNNNQRGNRPPELMINVYNDVTSNVEIFKIKKDTETSGTVYDEAGNVRGTAEIDKWGQGKAATQWRYSIDKLPQRSVYENGQSRSIYYWATARDTGLVPWYTTTDGQRNGLDVLLTHVNYLEDFGSSTKDFDVHINWMDNQDAWGYRPDTLGVDVELYANEDKTPYKTVHMTMANAPEENENTWTYRFKDLPTYLNGSAVVWKVKINDLPWYTETVSNYADYSVIKMTQSIGFDFRINWKDEDNDDAVRPEPEDMVLMVYGDGKYVGDVKFFQISAIAPGSSSSKPYGPNIMTASIQDLPVWRETDTTVPVQYTFQWHSSPMTNPVGTAEYLSYNGYSASASMNGEKIEGAANWYWLSAELFGDKADAGLNDEGMYQWETTLTRSRDVIDVSASVNWDDDANRDGFRPENVMLQLFADGEPFGEPVEVSEETEWTYIWKDLPLNEKGTQIEYTVDVVPETIPSEYSSENTDATHITLFHEPEQITLLSRINWMDNTELHFIRNSVGDLVTTLAQIKRVPVYAQLLANGEPYGEPVFIGTDDYDTGEDLLTWTPADWDGIYKTTKQIGYSGVKWEVAMANQSLPLYKFQNEGEEITYTFRIYSEDLNELLANDRHQMVYSEDHLTATITRELFDVDGVVYYLYDTADEFLLGDVTVTAYLYDEATKTYTAVGTAETAEDDTFTIENLPNGMLTFRATYQYGDYSYAGSVGLRVDRHDGSVKIIVDRDAEADSDLYRYKAEGKAFYQTDITDPSTIHEVPTGSIVLLYKTVHGQTDVQYVGMTTTGKGGAYKFENLAAGQYLVNVVFNFEGGTYTYDNADALHDGLTFNVLGADMLWPDIIKQVNKSVEPGPGPEDPDEPTPPDPVLPEPCIVSGDVFFSDNGAHTTDPVEGVDVYIYAAETNIELAHVVTDENGHWTVEGMGAQDYIAVFSYQGNASRVLRFTITDADYEAGTYEAAEQYFDRTTKEPTALIQGVVLNEQGERTSALVQILNQNGEVVAVAYTDKTGTYSFTVPAGLTYQVRILEVGEAETKQVAGDPDDELTTLDYYVISGNFSIDGEPQGGSTVAVYKQDEALDFNLLTATLTDENGDYAVKLFEGGNYNVVTYRNGEIYSQHKVSVGYQEWEPKVTEQDGTYTISGVESFDALELRDTTTGVIHLIKTLPAGDEYSISGLAEGIYDIKMIKGLEEKHYYIDCPKNEIDVTYFVTVAGSVTTDEGKAVLGAIVSIHNEDGKKVGEDTIITNGNYNYPELPEGKYEIRVKYPMAGETLADKTTADLDSYGIRYVGGMTEDSVWTWNINATKVSGNVKDQKGNPVAFATIVLRDNNDPNKAYGVIADENGNWTIGVQAGSYTVDAMYEQDADHIYHTKETKVVIVKNSAVDGVELVIDRFDLTVTIVRDGDKKPLPGADVKVILTDDTEIWTGKADENGNITLTVMPDAYKVIASFEDGEGEKTITVGSDLNETVTIGIPMCLTGTVTDNEGKRLENAIVTVNFGDDKTRTMQTSTNEMGVYRFEVEDGTYYITAIYEAANGYVYSTNAERAVHVNGADEREANLVITLAYPVTIIVKDVEDNVVEGAEVFFSGVATGSSVSDADGKVETMLPGGEYEFFAVIGNRKTPVVSAEVKSATSLTLVVGMPGLAEEAPEVTPTDLTIDGHVIDPNGNPVVGAKVILLLFNKETEEWNEVGRKDSTADGFYEFIGLDDGRYKVEIEYSLTDTVEGEHTRFEITGYALDENSNPYVGATVNLYDGEDLVETVYSDSKGYYEFLNLEHDGTYKVEIIPVNDEGEQTTIAEDVVAKPSNTVIEGIVVDAAGRPVKGATVVVTDEAGTQFIMTTEANGEYHFELDVKGEVNVTITYPASYEINTEKGYNPDNSDPNAPALRDDSYTIYGYAHDTDGNAVIGAAVKLLDKDGTVLQATVSNEEGYYEFEPVRPGEYTVTVTWGKNERSYKVDAKGNVKPVDPQPEDPEVKKIHVNGTVVTNHKTPLAGAVVTVRNADTGESFQLVADKDGMFNTGDMDPGRYELSAVYTHKYDSNSSDTVTVIRTQEDVALVIILSYVDDVNGNGKDETVFVGNDDKFDTPDDFYEADVGKDGVKDPVYAGEDSKPGTEKDYYPWDVDHDGEPEKVYVGEDKIPGTENDWYPVDVDDDGVDDKVFIGEDCIPGTEDDWYNKDVDGDGKDEKVYIGEDKTPGTEDDWYKDDEGNKIYLRVVITFNANGGSVNGKDSYEIPLRKLLSLPGASRNNYTFDGWFLQASGGSALTLAQLKTHTENVTVYAHWTAKSTTPGGNGGSGGSGGGGFSGGGGGGGSSTPAPVPAQIQVTFKGFGDKDKIVTVEKGSLVEAPTDIRTGYKLIGWFQDEKLTKEWDVSKDKVTKDMTLWAKLEYVGPSAYLNMDHIAYIGGFTDGTVRPTDKISRAEVAMIFYRLLNEETRVKYKTTEHDFADVAKGSWCETAIATLSNMGILKGRGHNVFDPTAKITRAEFAVIASRFDTLEEAGKDVYFSDLEKGSWYYEGVMSAAAKGWVKGIAQSMFAPLADISRAEVVTLINRVLDRDTITVESIVTADPMITWPDNAETSTWYYLAIQEATNGHRHELKGETEYWTSLTETHVGNK